MRIILHLGAHKTATTYLQETLAANRQALRARGVGYVPLDQMRATLTAQVTRSGFDVKTALAALVEEHSGCDRLILSDENLAGLCGQAVRDGTYYARIGERVGRVVEGAAGMDVEIRYATRAYPAFVASMYCEYLRHKPFLTIEEYLAAVDVDAFSWRRIVGTLCGLVGPGRVTTWRFEDFGAVEPAVFAALCGDAAPGLKKPAGPVRDSLSAKAVAALGAVRPVIGAGATRLLVPAISTLLSRQSGYARFEAVDVGRADEMRERYDRDLAALAAEFPQMRMLAQAAAPVETA